MHSHRHLTAYPSLVYELIAYCSAFFSGPLGGEISPPNTNKFKQPAGCFSHFLSPQKQFPPLNYISRKKPCSLVCDIYACLVTVEGMAYATFIIHYCRRPSVIVCDMETKSCLSKLSRCIVDCVHSSVVT